MKKKSKTSKTLGLIGGPFDGGGMEYIKGEETILIPTVHKVPEQRYAVYDRLGDKWIFSEIVGESKLKDVKDIKGT